MRVRLEGRDNSTPALVHRGGKKGSRLSSFKRRGGIGGIFGHEKEENGAEGREGRKREKVFSPFAAEGKRFPYRSNQDETEDSRHRGRKNGRETFLRKRKFFQPGGKGKRDSGARREGRKKKRTKSGPSFA